MSSACFETEGSSSGRQLYLQLRYGMLYMHQYKGSCRYKSVFETLEPNCAFSSFVFSEQILVYMSLVPQRCHMLHPVHPPNFIASVIYGEECKVTR
jgi:hypothetical protein